jgi:hypothetical protein
VYQDYFAKISDLKDLNVLKLLPLSVHPKKLFDFANFIDVAESLDKISLFLF